MKKLLTCCLTTFSIITLSANIICVNLNATGQNNGSSWTNAFKNLNNALSVAQYGDEIWVAKGAYFPYPPSPILSFVLVSGTKLLGGFNGTENNLNQRNWKQNETILYGDEPGFTWLNVLYAENTDSSTLLDGFSIRGGHADITIFGYQCMMPNGSDCAGGGLYLYNNTPDMPTMLTVRNCTFFNNGALEGGGIAANFANGSGGLVVQKCIFDNNGCNDVGGGLYLATGQYPQHKMLVDSCIFENNYGNTAASISVYNTNSMLDLRIANSIFRFNKTFYSCAGIYIGNGSLAKPLVENCLFLGNEAGGSTLFLPGVGGAMLGSNYRIHSCIFQGNKARYGGAVAVGGAEIVNCLFLKNYSKQEGGALRLSRANYLENNTFVDNVCEKSGGAIYNIGYTQDTILNCIFIGNRAGQSGDWMASNFGNDFVDFTLIDVADCDALKDGLHPMYDTLTCGSHMLFNIDPLFRDTAVGDYRLRGCSPLLNQGSSVWASRFGLVTDLAGNSRWQDGVPDLGAYETPRFNVQEAHQDANCYGQAEGSATINAEGGFLPYTFLWNTGSTADAITGLSAGTYNVVVTDNGHCSDTLYVSIAQPDSLQFEVSVLPNSNMQQPNGRISINSGAGGTMPYQYSWNTGSMEASIGHLQQGTYAVTITDQHSCSIVLEFEVLFLSGTENLGATTYLSAFPNPVSNWLNFTLPEAQGDRQMELMDATGKKVFSQTISDVVGSFRLSMENFPAGVYTILLRQQGQATASCRVVKHQ